MIAWRRWRLGASVARDHYMNGPNLSEIPEIEADVSAPSDVEPEQAPQTAETDETVTADAAIEAAAAEDAVADEEETDPAEADAPLEDGFAALGLSEPILRALHDKGYLQPTPIQAQAIPVVLMGGDVLGCAQTGTGKTAGFTLPMLDILSGSRARARMPRSLILEPTRELALQVAENFVLYGKYLKLNHALLIGGESMSDQKDALTKGVDVLIATPGRLIDLFERGGLLLTDVRVLVIDEADRMLDMGFIPDIERIVAMLPRKRQTLFFSATMAPEIRRLADAFLNSPREITVSKPATVATTITSGLVLVNDFDKREALRRLIASEDVQNALIFCNRKRDVDILLKSLVKHGFSAGALHGDLAQSVRFATLEKFKAGDIRLLVCSDVAARGIDIGGLSHVFNFDVPHHAEDYVHRIGRTGRAGRDGKAFSIAAPEDRQNVAAIETLIGAPIPRIEIPGLDVVEWAEDDGKRGRGRGGRFGRAAKPAAKAPARAADRPEEERAPRPERARAERARPERKPRAEPRQDLPPEPSRDTAPPRRDDRREGGRGEGGRGESRRDDNRRDENRRDDSRRDEHHRREPVRDRPDAGGNVAGFGPDVPAFMLIRKRGPRPQAAETPAEDDGDTALDEADIAA